MRDKPESPAAEDARTIRLAWWASFLATLTLIAGLGLARSAQALPAPAAGPPAAAFAVSAPDEEEESEGEDESEAGELEAGECEAGEEVEEEECGEAEDGASLEECVLSSASATVAASPANDRVRLTVHYTAFSPASVRVIYWLRGSKGPLSLGSDNRRLGIKGVLRQSERLGQAQMTKALAARNFTVQLRPAHAPRYCNPLLETHLTKRHAAAGGLTWSDPEASFRISRLY